MNLPGALLCGLAFMVPSAVIADPDSTRASPDRAEFRALVREYIDHTTPHCRPDLVQAYNIAHAERDSAFRKSIAGTVLAVDYETVVADVRYSDSRTMYECALPPAPPAAPGAPPPAQPSAAELKKQVDKERDAYFARGDLDFSLLVEMRNKILRGTGK